jgi:hypothetical protein
LRLESAATAAKVDATAAKVDATAAKVDANAAKVDANAAKVDATAAKVDATAAKVDAIAAAAVPQREHMTSPAVLGSRTLEALQEPGGVFTFEGAPGPPVLGEPELAELQDVREADNESGVVRYLTPKLWDILHSCRDEPSVAPLRHLLVNSEKNGWLDYLDRTVSADKLQKPDLFVTWEPFVRVSPGSGKQGSGDKFFCGPLAHRTLQQDGCVRAVLEAKKDALSPADFGELVGYHSHLPGRVNGVLFNHTDFWLTEAMNGRVCRVEKCQWGQSGTLPLLQRHFAAVCRPPPLAVLLAKLLLDLDVTLMRHGDSSFLGAGASGRVFAVQSASGAPQALKVVVHAGSLLSFSNEFALLQAAASSGAPVVEVVPDSLKEYPGLGGGYLMASVGSRVAIDTFARMRRVFDSLQAVHAAGAIHGDARLPNVIEVGGIARWADFVNAAVRPALQHATFVEHAREDMLTLSCSVLNVGKESLPVSVADAVGRYEPHVSAQAVAEAAWAAKR